VPTRGKLVWLAALVLIGASGLKADQVGLTFTGVNGNTMYIHNNSSGVTEDVYIDPYYGQLGNPGSTQNVTLFCVDPDHDVNFNQHWTVNRVYLDSGSDLSTTYQYQDRYNADIGGGMSASAAAADAQSYAYKVYSEFAWLIQQLGAAGNGALSIQQSIQAAIWNLADSNVVPAYGGGADFATWESAASSHTAMSGFYILSDATLPIAGTTSVQEYMITAPEASTLLLLGIGLLALVGVAFRRGLKSGVCAI
jgi:PEP-CTERM motif